MVVDAQSNIRVLVHWRDQTVFAGEDVKCTITFKNVAQDAEPAHSHQHQPSTHDRKHAAAQLSISSPRANRTRGTGSLNTPSRPPISNRGHRRSALSLSIPSTSSQNRSVPVQWPQGSGPDGGPPSGRPGHSHKRSLSIVSIGSAGGVDDHITRLENNASSSYVPKRGHNRASSLQISPQAFGGSGTTTTSALGIFGPRHTSSPLHNSTNSSDSFARPPAATGGGFLPNRRRSPRASPSSIPEFRFPAAAAAAPSATASPNEKPAPAPQTPQSMLSPTLRPDDALGLGIRQNNPHERSTPVARILSSSGLPGGTPRSSGEFYAMSNNSTETLASEYVAQPNTARNGGRPATHLRRPSALPPKSKAPESLMMGYAQIQGSFTLDGSLVSLSQFDQVKKKAVVGGRGGGVIGLETGKRESGILKSFGWGSISNSLGDLLGGNELSSIKELRGAANSKSVPLLSTPQSILFVDLQLAPGQSRSYEYTFRLPRGLPPTHKGKVMKISYSLVIGTQRAGGAKEQQVRSVEVPFRVLGSVNSRGEILGHDLMSPYILLRDEATVAAISKGHKYQRSEIEKTSKPATMNDFMRYVDELIAQQKEDRAGNLLSPSSVPGTRRPSAFEEVTSAKEAIHFAVMRSNIASEGQSQNRFEIARNGQRVGVVMLPRPAYRLGEVVTMVIDFAKAEIPCFAVHATLETSEKIDPSLAIRSESSIQRVTRKVYAASSEVTMYSRRVVFTPTIPINATPEFMTSSVSFDWKIRVEFVVPAQPGTDLEQAKPSYPLLEQLSQDEKGGLVLVAVENLACESFDVSVPIRVYGAVGRGLERLERDEAADEGLPV